jgi:hypothetical protein
VSADKISEYLAQFSQVRTQIVEQLRRAIVGQSDVIEQILAAIFTRGQSENSQAVCRKSGIALKKVTPS